MSEILPDSTTPSPLPTTAPVVAPVVPTPTPEPTPVVAPAPAPAPAPAMLTKKSGPSLRGLIIVIIAFFCFIAGGVAWYILVWQKHDPVHQAQEMQKALDSLPANPNAAKLTPKDRDQLLKQLTAPTPAPAAKPHKK